MSPKKPVENLRVLCLKLVISFSLDYIKSTSGSVPEELAVYLSKLPKILKEEILSEILGLIPLNSATKWASFCTFRGCCRKFDFHNVSTKYHEQFANKLENLVNLNAKFAKVTETTLADLIDRCPNLKSLTLSSLQSDHLFERIITLDHLTLLDIGHVSLTKKHLKYFSSPSLQVLGVGSCSKQYESEEYDFVAEVLPHLPNLREIRHYKHCGHSLLKLKSRSKLKVVCDSNTTIEGMIHILGICPELEVINLDNPQPDALRLLTEERGFLKKLSITGLLEDSGNSKQVLNLNTKTCIENLQVKNMIIDLSCLNLALERLLLSFCTIKPISKGDFNLRNLQDVDLIGSDVTRTLLITILENCNNLQKIGVSNDAGLTDLDIQKLCKGNSLKSLTEIWFSMAKQLTSASVIRLMNHCKKLTFCGTLNGWNIERSELNYLRCIIYFTNTNLNLPYFTCF